MTPDKEFVRHGPLPEAELTRIVEGSELACWRDLWRHVPVPVAADAGLHSVAVGSALALVCERAPLWLFNRVLAAGLHEPLAESDIDSLIGMYRDKGLDFAISLSPLAQPSGIAGCLEARGFEVVNHWAKMYRSTEPPPDAAIGFRIEEAGRERAVEVGEVIGAGFGLPPALQPILASTVRCEGNHVYVAMDDDRPVGVGVLTVHDGVGHLNTATTLAQYRGRGIQRALMAHRIRKGLTLGCRAFATETGLLPGQPNHSYNNMLRCGFRLAYERPNYLLRHNRNSRSAKG